MLDISVIIPTYNRSKILESLLESWVYVDKYTRYNYELIFSDDGSTDNTLDILDNYIDKLPIVIVKNKHGGPANARNKAFDESKGRIILFMGDDIFPTENILDKHIELHNKYLNISVLGKVDWHKDLSVNYLMIHITEIGNEQFSFNRLKSKKYADFRHFYTCNISVKKTHLSNLDKLFDNTFNKANYEDIELGYRLEDKGIKIYYDESILAFHYHPYEVEKFCQRQINAGEMSVVFRDLHPDLEDMLGIENEKKDFLKFKKFNIQYNLNYSNFKQKLEDIMNASKYYEDLLLSLKDKKKIKIIQNNLSSIYHRLFSLYYKFGLLSVFYDRDEVMYYLLERFFGWDHIFYHSENSDKNHEFVDFRKTHTWYIGSLFTKPVYLLINFIKYIFSKVLEIIRFIKNFLRFLPVNLISFLKYQRFLFRLKKKEIKLSNKYKKNKKIIFVWPTFLAVGGVERNTISIIKELKDKYDFVIINCCRLNQNTGSLHHQFVDHVLQIYNLYEIESENKYIDILYDLKNKYKPDLVWICNGSPWLYDNFYSFTKLFSNIPIVDQQVYDTNEGWIKLYDNLIIQKITRYIAINFRIRKFFIENKKINPNFIDLIYPVIEKSKFLITNEFENNKIFHKYNLPKNKKIFLFVGRLVDQKRPIDFLKLAEMRQNKKDEYFLMIGDGYLNDEVNQIINKNNLKNISRINFIDNMKEIYSIVSGLVITSSYEGLPIVFIESMVMGVPVIATDVGDISIFVDKYNCGEIISTENIGNISHISDTFEVWKDNLGLYKENLFENRDDIIDFFSSENISKQYDVCFNKSIKKYDKK